MNQADKIKISSIVAADPQAAQTLALFNEPDSCDNDIQILKTAVAEAGLDKVVPVVLQGDPAWSLHMLQNIPNLGAYKDPLEKKANEMYEGKLPVFTGDADALAASLSHINQLEMYVDGGAGFGAWFTMYWFTPPFVSPAHWQPMAGTPSSSTWVQSSKVLVGAGQTLNCSSFALTTSPLSGGDIVVMLINISGNGAGWINTGFFFRYDPNVNMIGRIETWGGVDTPQFAQTVVAPGS
jgi:hypothetical protein